MNKLILIAALILTGCGVSGQAAQEGIEMCANHKGVRYFSPNPNYNTIDVTCEDRTRFQKSGT